MDKIVYSMNALDAVSDMLKKFNITTRTKSQHDSKYYELESICEFAEEYVHWIFNPSGNLSVYRNEIENKHLHTKKDMDCTLKRTLRNLKWEIDDIYSSIQRGEAEAV